MKTIFEDVKKRLVEQGRVFTGKENILVVRHGASLNGEPVSGFTLSQDERWVCVPVYDDATSAFYGGYQYSPQCFEVAGHYECYTGDSILVLTQVYVLY